jgi:uncharacterized protein YegP (UPF0339 family)
MSARFEIVRGDAGHWVRFIAANSRTVFTSETYTRRAGAENAILSIGTALGIIAPELVENVPDREWFLKSTMARRSDLGVRVSFVDERTPR